MLAQRIDDAERVAGAHRVVPHVRGWRAVGVVFCVAGMEPHHPAVAVGVIGDDGRVAPFAVDVEQCVADGDGVVDQRAVGVGRTPGVATVVTDTWLAPSPYTPSK